MKTCDDLGPIRRRLELIGAVCLLLIIPIKLVRLAGVATVLPIIQVAPSFLGAAGLLLLLAGSGRVSPMLGWRITLLGGSLALAAEFAQLIPRPGIIAQVQYSFDPLDLLATLSGTIVAALIGRLMLQRASRE